MVNKFKIEYSVYLIAIFLVIFTLLCFYRPIKKIDMSGIHESDSIVLEPIKAELDNDTYVLSGVLYDINNWMTFKNWISGENTKILTNHSIILKKDDIVLKIPTDIKYNIWLEFSYENIKFSARIPKKYSDYYLGAISKDIDNNETYIFLDKKVEDYANN